MICGQERFKDNQSNSDADDEIAEGISLAEESARMQTLHKGQ
jgi:hypothetical protein